MERHQQKSSEVIIPVLVHGKQHCGSGRVSELNIIITIAISHGPQYGCTLPPALETDHEKSYEVCIPVLEHGRLHFGSGRVSVAKIMIKMSISHGHH